MELALAYLEEAQRLRLTLTVQAPKGREAPALLSAVTEDRVTLALQGPLVAERGDTLGLLLHMDGLRLKVSTTLVELKPGTAVLAPPTGIALAERRRKPRARLSAREGATATALTGLFDGIGVMGPIENLSEGGLRMRVERAMDVKTQRRMHPGTSLLAVKQPLMLVKLAKLPKCPTLELTGSVAYLEADREGLCIGITFEPGKESLLGPVRQLVASRASSIPSSVPPKTRRTLEEPSQAEPESSRSIELAAPRPEPLPVPQPQPVPIPAPPPESAAPEPPAPAPAAEGSDRSHALLRVKKRSRALVLAMHPGQVQDQLAAFLAEDGYGRILAVATLSDLLEALDEAGGVHLVFIDGGVAELEGLELASLIHHRFEGAPPPIVLAEDHVDTDLVLASREAGVTHILVKPYAPDADLARLIEAQLGLA
ncbi:MAG: response regulator [Acidobacteriota bacterium]|nr:response regulator [Acidobacteriota bacterium]